MSIQLADSTKNARLDSLETEIGTAPTMAIRTGVQPAGGCAAADSGSLLWSIVLPSDWMQNASGGQKVKSAASWSGAASGGGTAGHFRIYTGGACKMQGSCGIGTGDLQLDNTSITASQVITITGFTLIDGN